MGLKIFIFFSLVLEFTHNPLDYQAQKLKLLRIEISVTKLFLEKENPVFYEQIAGVLI